MLNFNFNNPDNVAKLQRDIDALLEQLPDNIALYELTEAQKTLTTQASVAYDCTEAHLDMVRQRLRVVVARYKAGNHE